MKKMIILSALLIAGVTSAYAQSSSYVLTSSDAKILYGTFQHALENNPTQQATSWSNSASGLTGVMIPVATYRTPDWQNCRDYFASLQISGIKQQAVGTACRQPEGRWKIIREQQIGTQIKMVQIRSVAAGHPGCNHKEFNHPPVGQAKIQLPPHTKRHFHANPHNHIHGNKYQQGKQDSQRAMPQVKPKNQLLRYPSKLIKLVEYHAE